MGPKSRARGEIVQVQGGHIIRGIGRKDRHSKVFTAKGPRDRRLRLSAPTAIQFYDVQDRLGFDRPSKAVDWLINKAKASIDKLAELPPLDPIANTSNTLDMGGDHSGGSSFYVPQCVDSQSFGDGLKSIFPTSNSNTITAENSINIQNRQNQDLCLSLHTVQDLGSHSNHGSGLFQGSGSSLEFNGVWVDSQQQRMIFSTQPLAPQGLLFGPMTTATYAQWSTLQSSFSPLVRVFQDHHHHHHDPEILGSGPE